jgi:hypothetical protein
MTDAPKHAGKAERSPCHGPGTSVVIESSNRLSGQGTMTPTGGTMSVFVLGTTRNAVGTAKRTASIFVLTTYTRCLMRRWTKADSAVLCLLVVVTVGLLGVAAVCLFPPQKPWMLRGATCVDLFFYAYVWSYVLHVARRAEGAPPFLVWAAKKLGV